MSRHLLRRLILPSLLAVLAAMLANIPVLAAIPINEPAASEPETVQQSVIASEREAGSDSRIADRIERIFSQLPALADIEVSVSEGVVKLSGSVADPKDAAKAEAIAARVEGVVTVVRDVKRSVSVDETVGLLESLADRFEDLLSILPSVGVAIFVAFVVSAIGYLLASLGGFWRRVAPNSFLAELIASAVKFVFVIAGLVVALDMIGASALLGAVLGGAGLIGLALGFAMRDTVENYVASLMLSVRQPFRANDWVVIGEYEGRVIRLTSRATILMTLDGNHLRIPNATVFKSVILNYTRNPERRFEFDLGIDAEDDPNIARQLGVDVLASLDFVLDDPPPSARLEEVGDSNIVIKFLGWIDQTETDWYKARSQAIPAVKSALEKAGFALPEPIYRLRFDAGAPLPLQRFTGEAPPPPPASGPATTAGKAAEEHVAPDDVIAEMVERERKETPEAGKDLLDPDRPVE